MEIRTIDDEGFEMNMEEDDRIEKQRRYKKYKKYEEEMKKSGRIKPQVKNNHLTD